MLGGSNGNNDQHREETIKIKSVQDAYKNGFGCLHGFPHETQGATHQDQKGRADSWVILNNGEIEYCYSEAKKKGISPSSFMRAIDALVENGLIDIPHPGVGGWERDKSQYAISERWQDFGTAEFVPSERQKDKRHGRGFKKGNDLWKKNLKTIAKNESSSTVKNDKPRLLVCQN